MTLYSVASERQSSPTLAAISSGVAWKVTFFAPASVEILSVTALVVETDSSLSLAILTVFGLNIIQVVQFFHWMINELRRSS